MVSTDPRYVEEMARAARLRAEFIERHGVRPCRNSRRNVGRILRSAGVPGGMVLRFLDAFTPDCALSGPFDHGEIWGKAGRPHVLVGHPYHLTDEERAALDDFRGLGLDVRTDGESYYGFGTLQVLVFARVPTPRKPAPPSPGRLDAPAFEAAVAAGFVVTRGVRQRAHLDYYDFCWEARRPYVVVRLARGRAYVRLDMDPCGWPLAEAAIPRARDLYHSTPGLARSAWMVTGGAGVGFYGAPADLAPTIAFRLYELALDSKPAEDAP